MSPVSKEKTDFFVFKAVHRDVCRGIALRVAQSIPLAIHLDRSKQPEPL